MTQQQAQNRNYTIYRLRGQLNLFKNIPTDIIGFNEDKRNALKVLIYKLETGLRATAFSNRKYTYYCGSHLPHNPKGFVKTTRNSSALCSVCGVSLRSSHLFYIKKDLHASTDES